MTTLVGLHYPGRGTWFGSDSRATSDNLKIGPIVKWVRHGRWAVGCAGDLKTLNIMQTETDALLNGARSASEISKRMERMLATHNFSAASDGFGPPAWGQSFLIASDEGLWDMDMTLSLFQVPGGTLWATGSGRDFALGAGFASVEEKDPRRRVELAVNAAMTFDVMSGHGAHIDHLEPHRAVKPHASVKISTPRRKKAL